MNNKLIENKNKKNINPNIFNILFLIIVVNLIPIILKSVFNFEDSMYTLTVYVAYGFQIILMAPIIIKNLKKLSMRNLLFLILFIFISISSMIITYFKYNELDVYEFFYFLSSTLNIFVLILLVDNVETKEKDAYIFFKRMTMLGVISGIFNIIINFKDLFRISSVSSIYSLSFSSFFLNRNQYGLFLVIIIISFTYLIKIKQIGLYKKVGVYVFLLANMLLTFSRNSVLGILIFAFILILFNFKNVNRNKKTAKKHLIIVSIAIIILMSIIFIFIVNLFTNKNFFNEIDKLFLRTETLKTGSGRTTIWSNAFKILSDGINIIFSVGRHRALEINYTVFNNRLEHFHSEYLEILITRGLSGFLLYIYLLLVIVFKKIKKLDIKSKYKNILYATLTTFLVIGLFETITRFSVGYVDTIGIIFYFSIPLLICNLKEESLNSIEKNYKV